MADLARAWKLRTALAAALELAMDEVGDALAAASTTELVEFISGFTPARAPGPEWVATFDRLVEQIWDAVDPERIAEIEQEFRSRGPLWVASANSFTPARGEALRSARWRPPGARRPAVVLR
jgi:hypothetical protein